MDRRIQHLLIKLAEEASEVSKEALKAAQFGLDSKASRDSETNLERLHNELHDLHAITVMLNTESNFAFALNTRKIDEKIKRVNHYYEFVKKVD